MPLILQRRDSASCFACRGVSLHGWSSRNSVGRLCLETPHVASAPSTASRSPETVTRAPGSAPQDSQPAVEVTALTTRDDFLLELGQALGGQAAVRPVDSLDEALQSMAGGNRGQIMAIDAREVADVRAAVDAAQTQVPRAVVLVFAEGPAEKELGAALKGTKVFAVLPAEIEPRKTQVVFEGAMAEALARNA